MPNQSRIAPVVRPHSQSVREDWISPYSRHDSPLCSVVSALNTMDPDALKRAEQEVQTTLHAVRVLLGFVASVQAEAPALAGDKSGIEAISFLASDVTGLCLDALTELTELRSQTAGGASHE